MPRNTHAVIATKTVTSVTPFVLFDNISQDYTNLEIHAQLSGNSNDNEVYIQVGSSNTIDTNQNYSSTFGLSNGSSALATRQNNLTAVNAGRVLTSTSPLGFARALIKSYSNTTTYKPILTRTGAASTYTYMNISMWRSSNAINTVKVGIIGGYNLSVGTTVTLYGIGGNISNARAAGGLITADDTYYYHYFPSTSTFTPTANLTADILCIAGGGGGWAGAGGAGGHVVSSSQSLASGTAYTVTVGGGGTAQTTGGQGGNSNVTGGALSLTAAVGGGYGGGGSGMAGGNGGSGGGGGWGYGAGGSGTAGQGYAGGAGSSGGGGAGGGATSAGDSGPNGYKAGTGTTDYSEWGIATGLGEAYNGVYYFCGGGGYSANNVPSGGGNGGLGGGGGHISGVAKGMPHTGGGGNGDNAGGSGVVVIRYRR